MKAVSRAARLGWLLAIGALRRLRPPDADAPPPVRARQQSAYDFFRAWSSGRMPKMLVALIQDPNPFYDDAYAVNSENLGPYGDAVVDELIPHVEKELRGIGEPWARTTFGGSTGSDGFITASGAFPSVVSGPGGFRSAPCPAASVAARSLAFRPGSWRGVVPGLSRPSGHHTCRPAGPQPTVTKKEFASCDDDQGRKGV